MERVPPERVARALKAVDAVKVGHFVLASGKESLIYLDLRRLRSFPGPKKVVVDVYEHMLEPLDFDLLADVPTSATVTVSSLSDRLLIPQITPRPERKSHGMGNNIDGVFQPGQRVALIDDLVTTGGSIIQAAKTLREADLIVENVAVLVDRMQGGREALEAEKLNLHSYTTLPFLLEFYAKVGLEDPEEVGRVMVSLGFA